MKTIVVGLGWDDYTPRVQAQLFRDVLALKEDLYKKQYQMQVFTPKDDADWLLRSLGITIVPESLPNNWLIYQVGKEAMIPPGDPEDVLVRKLPEILVTKPNIQTKPSPGLALKEQGYFATPFRLIDRPAPTAYSPSYPSYLAIMFGTM